MSVNHSGRSGGKKEISFRFSLNKRYIVRSHKSPHHIVAILMSKHNIPFSI